jgi:hypothetical protein
MRAKQLTVKDGVYLSKKERNQFEVINEFLNKRITRAEAALALDCTIRTVSRIAKAVSVDGLRGVIHGNHGKDPWNKLEPAELDKIKTLILGKYQNFNITHALEYLVEKHDVKIHYTKLRSICHSIHAVKRTKRRAKVRRYRQRHPAEGYLLQMDGSTHEWINGEKWCLISAIDDATSDIPYAEFIKTECLEGVMRVVRKIIEIKGIPWALYLDRANWFAGWKPNEKTQFQRICKELGIRIIPAFSAQAKGRIERSWDTLQDRLVAEFGLYEIKTMSEATRYLNHEFIPNTWRKKMTVIPESSEYLYKPIPIHMNLDHIFCLKFNRKVRADHTITYQNIRYKITTKLPYSIARRMIEIRITHEGKMEGWLNERNLELESLVKCYGNRYAA